MTELATPAAFELAGNLANGLDSGRLFALGLAADLHNRHGLALSRDLADAIGNADALSRDLADAHDLARIIYSDRSLANLLGNACARAHGIARDLAEARAHDRAARADPVDPGLTADRALAGARAYADARDRARLRAMDLARDLADTRDFAGTLAKDLVLARDLAAAASIETGERDEQTWPTRPAVRVAWTAAGLLPRQDRIRYDLEYRNELAELAAGGAGRREQLRYAARLLVRAPLMRAELARARRRREASQ